ncbi:MAG: hypothetical protein RLY30_1810 [Pseudomonadota bacterium]
MPAQNIAPSRVWARRTGLIIGLLALAGCGGGENTAEVASPPRIVAFGDSLADTGTFGVKAVTQGAKATGVGSNPVLTTAVATALGSTEPCAFFRSNGAGGFTNTTTCTGFAIGGGKVNNPAAPTSPLAIPVQLATAATALGGYKSTDLVLIDAAGNDAADLIGAFLTMQQTGNPSQFIALTSSVLGPSVAQQIAAAPATAPAQVGTAYMAALATVLHGAIKTTVLDKGATRVVLVGQVKVASTPRLNIVLTGLQKSLGAAGPATRASLEGLFTDWVNAFNINLEAKFAGDSRVLVFNGYQLMGQMIANPSAYGLTNVVDASCPPVGLDPATGPIYNLATCTEAASAAWVGSGTSPITGKPLGGDWRTYLFSDNFHPSPKAYTIVGDAIGAAVKARGW